MLHPVDLVLPSKLSAKIAAFLVVDASVVLVVVVDVEAVVIVVVTDIAAVVSIIVVDVVAVVGFGIGSVGSVVWGPGVLTGTFSTKSKHTCNYILHPS